MGSSSLTLAVEAAAPSMKTLVPVLAMAALVGVVTAGRRQAYTPYISPGQLFGSSAPAPCCRSSFPEEPGSCLANEHCIQETAPYCSAFGFYSAKTVWLQWMCGVSPTQSLSQSIHSHTVRGPQQPIHSRIHSRPPLIAITALVRVLTVYLLPYLLYCYQL